MPNLTTIKKLHGPLSFLVRLATGPLILVWTLIAMGFITERAAEARLHATFTWADNISISLVFWGTFICGLYWGARVMIQTACEAKDGKDV